MMDRTEALRMFQDLNTIYACLVEHPAVQETAALEVWHPAVLLAFETRQRLTASQLTKTLSCSPARTAMVMKKLLQSGLVATGFTGNGHQNYMLTPTGKALQQQFMAARRKTAERIMTRLRRTEQRAFLASLQAICQILKKLGALHPQTHIVERRIGHDKNKKK